MLHICRLVCIIAATAMVISPASANDYDKPWRNSGTSIVLDAYEYTPLDWTKMKDNQRLAGFINKASDGLPPKYNCGRNPLCRVTWRRYSAAKELYHTRRILAKTLGLKWGAYHLGRPGNPRQQADHFLRFAKPDKDDLIAIDIEHNDPSRWMSLSDAEIFARVIKARTGRYPVLYTNHHTAKFIAENRAQYRLLSRLNLWYARYKPSIPNVFPMGNWDNYSIWQFSSMVNCNNRRCPWRINGAGNWIDVNVVAMPPEELRKRWPFAELTARKPTEQELFPTLYASAYPKKKPVFAQEETVAVAKSGLPAVKMPDITTAFAAATARVFKRNKSAKDEKMAKVGKIPFPKKKPLVQIVKIRTPLVSDIAVPSAKSGTKLFSELKPEPKDVALATEAPKENATEPKGSFSVAAAFSAAVKRLEADSKARLDAKRPAIMPSELKQVEHALDVLAEFDVFSAPDKPKIIQRDSKNPSISASLPVFPVEALMFETVITMDLTAKTMADRL